MTMREPLFILSPPRSFSSLISSIIGQHPELHAFPELQIFGRSSLQDMMIRNQESLNRLASPGSIRAVAEVHEQKQTSESCARAWLWMQSHSYMSPVEFFNYLQAKIYPLIAVEKTPVNTLKISRLREIVGAYPNAKFLHLTRSVVGNYSSLEEFLGEKGKFITDEDSEQLSAKALSMDHPASIWHAAHRNILTIRPLIKTENYLRIKGEDLLNSPTRVLSQFCKWMGIDNSSLAIQSMLRPHESPYACIGPRIAHGGNDGKFMRQPVLRHRSSMSNQVKSFHQSTDAKTIRLDKESLQSRYSQLQSNELAQIEEWAARMFKEIEAMQLRLGY